MATLSSLTSKLTLDTTDFRVGIEQSQKKTKSFGSSIAAVGRKVAKYKTGIAAVGATAAYFGVTQAQMMVQTQRVADTIGASTLELSRMQYAAVKTGASIGTIRDGLIELQLRLGEAKTGTGATADAIRALGLDLDKLTNMKPVAAMKALSDELNKLSNEDRTFFLEEFFGGGGRELSRLLLLGADGLSQLGKEADKLHNSFTAEEANKVTWAYNQWIDTFSQAKGSIIDLAGVLGPFVGAVGFVVKWAVKLVDTFGRFIAIGIKGTVLLMVKAFELLGRSIIKVVNVLPGVEINASTTFDGLAALTDALKDSMLETANNINFTTDSVNELGNARLDADAMGITQVKKEVQQLTQELEAAADAKEKLKAQTANANAALKLLIDERNLIGLEGVDKYMAQLENRYDLTIKQLDALRRQYLLNEKLKQQAKDMTKVETGGGGGGFLTDMFGDVGNAIMDAGGWVVDQAQGLFNTISDFEPPELGGAAALVTAGSARSQALQFGGFSQEDVPRQQLDVQKRQLDLQQRMATSLDEINEGTIETVGI